MNSCNQALTVYNKAKARWDARKETQADEVLLSLWDENKELAQTIREMAQKISMLEMQSGATVRADTVQAVTTYDAMMARINNQAPVA